ncbi:P-loop containing nucleoside triphosphate hydrolase protein [Schizophyllum amplum]|uniref:P-loop containing nucleoside triphosphate hydrolase protein n=1 Tax=Schizophyllum amplum TaxID=97359 RepID=A0A550CSM8_9AGAR|nr:P-loop containing nucleoside triphosphate hydrolase protein [Auriculariopsis ampla]
MSVPLTIGRLIDFFSTPEAQIPFGLSLTSASVALVALFTLGALANAGRAVIMRLAGQRIIARLRTRTYSAALRQDVDHIERHEGDIVSRLAVDSSIVGDSVTQNLSDGLRSIVQAGVGLGAMFYISPTLTMLMLAVVPPVSLGAVFYGRYLKKLSHRTQEAIGDMTKTSSEALAALRTVQAYNAYPREEKRFNERVSRILALARQEAIASGIFFGSTGWSGNLTVLGLLGYGGTLVSAGTITVGDLTSLLLYTVYVGSGLQMLTTFFSSIMRGVGAAQRVFDLLERPPVIPPEVATLPAAATVRFEGVRFEYPARPGVDVLRNFDLEIKAGESVAIVGSSGGGKSSVHALLLRFFDPVEGRVMYGDVDVRRLPVSAWRSRIGVVPQDPVLFTGTVAENVAFGWEDAPREAIEAAARAANCEFVWGMPQGFDTPISRLSLSGGQRQRLAIARALLRRPAILALDEATSSLDAGSEERVNDAIDRVLRDRQTTCLIVAHRLSTIARAERIVVLEGGRITESGTYRELARNPDSRFRALMAAQLDAADGGRSRSVDEPAQAVEDGEEATEVREGEVLEEAKVDERRR